LRDLHSFPTRRSSDLAFFISLDVLIGQLLELDQRLLSRDLSDFEGLPSRLRALCDGDKERLSGHFGVHYLHDHLVQVQDLADIRSEEHTSELQSLAYL